MFYQCHVIFVRWSELISISNLFFVRKYFGSNTMTSTNFHDNRTCQTCESFINVELGTTKGNGEYRNSLLYLVEEVCRICSESPEKFMDCSTLNISIRLLVSHVQKLMQQLPVLSPSFTIRFHPIDNEENGNIWKNPRLQCRKSPPHPMHFMRILYHIYRLTSECGTHRSLAIVLCGRSLYMLDRFSRRS